MPKVIYNFRGFIVPVFTPFEERTMALNLSIIPKYAKFLADKGVTGILVNGTSGEGTSMSVSERKEIAEAWATAVKTTKQHLMIQIGGAPLPDVLQLAKHAEEIQADAILCLPELYFKPSEPKQLIEYLKIVGASAPNTPLLYYHIPMFTNVHIHMGQFMEMMANEISTFVGIKFTSTNLEEGSQALRAQSGQFVVFLGSDQIMSAGCAVGMDSFIATSINIVPNLAMDIFNSYKRGNTPETFENQEKLSKVVMAISKYGNWIVTMKTAMALLSPINCGPVRAPLQSLNADCVASMKRDLEKLDFSS